MTPGADFEVAVVGGGVVGGTLAVILGGSGIEVALVEARTLNGQERGGQEPGFREEQDEPGRYEGQEPPPLVRPDPDDARVLALTRASERVLRAIGVWHSIEAEPIGRFREMRVWDEGGQGAIHFDSAEIGEPLLGHIVPACLIEAAVATAERHLPTLTAFRPARLEAIGIGRERVDVRLADGRGFSARLVVGADGASSRVRALCGIAERVRDYRQSALCCTVVSELPHGDVARQRFLSTGPLAFLPLAEARRSAIVWSTTHEAARALVREPDPAFRKRLTLAYDAALGNILECGPRSAFPLVRGHAERYTGARVALIGDAAHRIHPLAGQGANLGIMDAAALAEVLQDARRAGSDLGELRVLRRYERWRKGENMAMMLIMDAFKEVFGTELAPLRLLRNLGLSATDAVLPLKRRIMRRGAGLTGDLPRLALESASGQRR